MKGALRASGEIAPDNGSIDSGHGNGTASLWRAVVDRVDEKVYHVAVGAELDRGTWVGEAEDVAAAIASALAAVALGVLLHVPDTSRWVLALIAASGVIAILGRVLQEREESFLLPWVRVATTAGAVHGLLLFIEWLQT